jgi:hypothetical protein
VLKRPTVTIGSTQTGHPSAPAATRHNQQRKSKRAAAGFIASAANLSTHTAPGWSLTKTVDSSATVAHIRSGLQRPLQQAIPALLQPAIHLNSTSPHTHKRAAAPFPMTMTRPTSSRFRGRSIAAICAAAACCILLLQPTVDAQPLLGNLTQVLDSLPLNGSLLEGALLNTSTTLRGANSSLLNGSSLSLAAGRRCGGRVVGEPFQCVTRSARDMLRCHVPENGSPLPRCRITHVASSSSLFVMSPSCCTLQMQGRQCVLCPSGCSPAPLSGMCSLHKHVIALLDSFAAVPTPWPASSSTPLFSSPPFMRRTLPDMHHH